MPNPMLSKPEMCACGVASAALENLHPAKHSARTPLSEKRLVIRLRVSNAGASRLVHYAGWNAEDPSAADAGLHLRDDRGQEILAKVDAKNSFGKRVQKAEIPPEKWVDDLLVFEAPTSNTPWLRLELPGAAIGAQSKLQFQIPSTMIQNKTEKAHGKQPTN